MVDFLIALLFIGMVLAPAFVASYHRRHEEKRN
jgi:hypothetical protein